MFTNATTCPEEGRATGFTRLNNTIIGDPSNKDAKTGPDQLMLNWHKRQAVIAKSIYPPRSRVSKVGRGKKYIYILYLNVQIVHGKHKELGYSIWRCISSRAIDTNWNNIMISPREE